MKKSNIVIGCLFLITITLSPFLGIVGGFIGQRLAQNGANNISDITNPQNVEVVKEESAIISVAEESKNSVVSVIITKDVPLYEDYFSDLNSDDPFSDFFNFKQNQQQQIGTEEQQVGAGTGFIITEDGMIITNKHVVEDEDASYTVFFTDGSTKEASVVAKDTLLDIAFLDIEGEGYDPLDLGTSTDLKVGQTVIAIGNALGEFSNSVSAGIISGLSRNIIAQGSTGGTESLNDVIQTDASINLGNSGGPLLDVKGNVIGVNVAVAQDAENIGFAIPIDVVKDLLSRLQEDGSIERPRLGVRFVLINEQVQEANELDYDYGALISKGQSSSDLAVLPGSPADKAGLVENDIILEVNGTKVTEQNPLNAQIQALKIGDEVTLKVFSKGNEKDVKVKLEKF